MKRSDFMNTACSTFLGFIFNSGSPFRNVHPLNSPINLESDDRFTVGVIGSGVSGLTIAALLAKYGFKVQVFESNRDYFGGHARILKIGNNEFSAGPQYLWNFGEGEVGNRVLKYLGIVDDISFQLMNENSFENYFIGHDDKISIPMGIANFKDKLLSLIPEEEKGITDFFYYFNQLFKVISFLHDEGLFIENFSTMKMKLLSTSQIALKPKLIANKMGKWSLKDLFDYCNLSQRARRLLYGNGGIFAENESEVSLALFVAGLGYFHKGAYKPEKGFYSLIDGLVNSIKSNGGELYLDNRISKINVNSNKADSLTNYRNEVYPVDLVISNISPNLTCKLLNSCKKKKFAYQPSNSLTSCFIELDSYTRVNDDLKGKNYWWQKGENEVNYINPDMLKEPEMIYAGSPSADIENTNEQLLILYVPGSFSQSEDCYNQGLEEYEAFKDQVWRLILNKLDEVMFPQIKEHIKSITLYTPYDLYIQIDAEGGSVYGRRATFKSISRAIYDVSNVDNLHLVNATMSHPGVAAGFQLSTVLFSKLTKLRI